MNRTSIAAISFISLISIVGCATNVNFVYKKPVPELKSDLSEQPQVCIALMSKNITDIKESLITDFKQFAGIEIYFNDITDEIVLSEDRKAIINDSGIALKYPKVQYLMVFYQNASQISYDFFKRKEKEEHFNKDGSTVTRYTGYDIFVYVTEFSAVCDTFLFDLKNSKLLAQASDVFKNREMIEDRELFPDHTLLGLLSDLTSNPKDDKERYPTVKGASVSSKHKYFYAFLNSVYK
ncbi:MAG: hypothetical protein P8X96_13095 [Desulfobacteraceae bacterium]|jgi:DNA replicative helicase MCM subunit Mcm2 (Cdc46/Mcm family)